MLRKLFDYVCRTGIKAVLLTGVAFTMAACYGPPPERHWQDEPAFQEDQEKVEDSLSVERQKT